MMTANGCTQIEPQSAAASVADAAGNAASAVPYVDLARQHQLLKQDLMLAVEQVLDSGQFILGQEVERFERAFAVLCGTRFAIGVSSGTDALVLCLKALDIGPGDEVITAPNSFVATAAAIIGAGATPVFADVGQDLNLDPVEIAQAIGPRTRAIVPVHLTGRPANMTAIMAIARRHKLYVVEDAAQALLAEHAGRRVGSFGCCNAFSLHPLKNLGGCGDAGVVTCDDPELADRIRVLRNLGLRSRDNCVTWSGNSRLDTMQAAFLLAKLPYLERWTLARRAHADFYRQRLADIEPVMALPVEETHDRSVYHTFVIQADRRDELAAFLAAKGIGTAIHYPVPIHLQDAAKALGYRAGSFPRAEQQARRMLSLPIYPELTHDQLEHVAASIRRFYRV